MEEGYELCSPGQGKGQTVVSFEYINLLVFPKIRKISSAVKWHVAFQMGYVPSGWL
jgi:hypothetical protein